MLAEFTDAGSDGCRAASAAGATTPIARGPPTGTAMRRISASTWSVSDAPPDEHRRHGLID
tara:strand:+ start:797 stop:979 length:183 start_codon:yes stop_codon:yes gene_type:complete